MASPPIDLLIVGAGPVGLAVALGAIYRGANAKRILIVDQARELRKAGKSLSLLPNAYRALLSVAPGMKERLKPYLRTPNLERARSCSVNAEGTTVSTLWLKERFASLFWWELQRLLLQALPDKEILVLNHQLVDVIHEEGTGLVCAEFVVDRQRENRFKNWEGDNDEAPAWEEGVYEPDEARYERYFVNSTTEGSISSRHSPNVQGTPGRVKCRAKVMVGADGINSVVRRCIYRDSGEGWEQYAKALYSGVLRIGLGGSVGISEEHDQQLQEVCSRNSELVSLIANEDELCYESLHIMVLRLPERDKTTFQWLFFFYICIDEDIVKNGSREEIMDIISDKTLNTGHSKMIVDVCQRFIDNGVDYAIRSFYGVPAVHPPPYEALSTTETMDYPSEFRRPWYYRRIVLAGDSAHAMPPLQAQGTAMGLEDALELLVRLEQSGIWSELASEVPGEELLRKVFEGYFIARLERVCEVQRVTMNRPSDYREELAEFSEKVWGFVPPDFGRFT